MSEKKKKQGKPVGTIPFVLLWTLSYGLGWFGLISGILFLAELFPSFMNGISDLVLIIVFGNVPGLISGVIQQPLIRWKFGTSVKHWWLWSTIGSIVAMGGFYIYSEYLESLMRPVMAYLTRFNELLEPALIIGVLFVIYSTFQAWALRHTVRRIWLWSLAAFVSASTFLLPFLNNNFDNDWLLVPLGSIAGLLQGSVMALTLVWLFGMTRAEPLKRGMESNQLGQTESNPSDDDSDESVADYPQQEAMMRQSK